MEIQKKTSRNREKGAKAGFAQRRVFKKRVRRRKGRRSRRSRRGC
jgi:hypothetical protein